jgi:hypothetical protein
MKTAIADVNNSYPAGLAGVGNYFLVAVLLLALLSPTILQAREQPPDEQIIGEFLLLLLGTDEGKREALEFVETNWEDGFAPMLLEVFTFNRDPAFGPKLVAQLERGTGQSLGFDIEAWQAWLWNREAAYGPYYADFKSALYGMLDERFEAYFARQRPARIRLDEVVWGGVAQDGIPPLRNPDMIPAAEADYLADGDIVFGLAVDGDIRAYPRRILGWHEMFVDKVGGVPVVGVYCTLCGTMILYRSEADGRTHELGTSGFLYRSNKLMYDRATQSLWNTIWGRPVIGPLAGKGISLERLSVVTTNWGEWRRRYPQSQVLSLGTGYTRDYREGAAYRDYYATDELMFQVPELDARLGNKDEVVGLVLPAYPDRPLAIAAVFLAANPVYHDAIGDQQLLVLTDPSGANRVYQADGVRFASWDGDRTAIDDKGVHWRLDEAALSAPDGRVLHRLPAHRAFWFGWYSAYSHTRLVQ